LDLNDIAGMSFFNVGVSEDESHTAWDVALSELLWNLLNLNLLRGDKMRVFG
jgi:hypothetical protein